MIIELKNCRVCGSKDLIDVVDLGELYPSGFLKPDEKLSDDMKVPLVACKCNKCDLVQLRYTIELDDMYRQYWYSSSLNRSMVSSLKNVVDDVEGKVSISDDDYVVDIGCNDGTMLQMFNKGIKVGFDPALNLHKPNCHTFVNDYFTADAFRKITDKKAKIITAIAMYYDLPDPVAFTKDVASILDEKGIFVVQFTDLLSMFRLTAYDSFCLEHLEYYKLIDVVNIFKSAGLRVFDVSYNDVNGGSVRVSACHDQVFTIRDSVIRSIEEEREYFKKHDFEFFNSNIEKTKMKVQGFLKWAKSHNLRIHLLGASTKGSTLIQHCEVTNELVPFAAEVNPDKFGLRTSGSNIEILSEADSLIKRPDYMIVPVWHFKKSILNSKIIREYLESGGHLVFPLPYFHVVTKTGEFQI